jgi:hypothetical protein
MQLPLAILLSGFLALSPAAGAQVPSFRITQIYSNLDGSLQFVRLTESEGRNGQHHLAGLTLTASADGIVRTFTFPSDLATDRTARMSFVVAVTATGTLPVEDDWDSYCCHPPEYAMPGRFLPTERGTVDFAGVDRVHFASLPADGRHALDRNGRSVFARVPANGGCYPGMACDDLGFYIADRLSPVHATEYFNAGLDHYFVTAAAADMDALESGRSAGWQPTGKRFIVAANPQSHPEMVQKVCRYRLPSEAGDSHFFSASAPECAEVAQRFPQFILETDAAFYVALPNPANGICPRDPDFPTAGVKLSAVYRLWNRRADTNHRYTTDRDIRDAMVAMGYVAEGYGPDAVAFCVR